MFYLDLRVYYLNFSLFLDFLKFFKSPQGIGNREQRLRTGMETKTGGKILNGAGWRACSRHYRYLITYCQPGKINFSLVNFNFDSLAHLIWCLQGIISYYLKCLVSSHILMASATHTYKGFQR